jgi:hypothetical protein
MHRMSQRIVTTLIAIALATLSLGGLAACSPKASTSSEPTPPPPSQADKAEKDVLEEFLVADTKQGDFDQTTTYADGSQLVQSGTLWLDGDLFRYDLYQDGELLRSIMTPDGETAYFAQHDEQISEPSVASVEHYLRQFNAPPVESVEDGRDAETGALRIMYVVQETANMSGSSNPWYTEDVVFLVKDGSVIGIISRGAVPEDDGSIEDLQETRRIFSDLRAGVEIDPATFELPYPISDAE